MSTATRKLNRNPALNQIKKARNSRDYLQNALSYINPLKATNMPTLTLCEGTENHFKCPIRELCFRYKAKADPNLQAWFAYLPYNIENERCDSFISLENSKKVTHVSRYI